jgi:uncharacterized flavoprotein (TIGR03862 family)
MSARKSAPSVAVIGAGPAGLFAAEKLSAQGIAVTIYDRMRSPARKFLMAGRGGLNLTHTEDKDSFLSRYGAAQPVQQAVMQFPPQALRDWCHGLGEPTFVGSSGRVFPESFKASPLLRAWLRRLEAQKVMLRTAHRWTGLAPNGALRFETETGPVELQKPDALVLAMGGASWPRLGSDGRWMPVLQDLGVPMLPFQPANMGCHVAWSPFFAERFAGQPLKRIGLTLEGQKVYGEAMVTGQGLEGGAVYALSSSLRRILARDGKATLHVELRPDFEEPFLIRRLSEGRKGESLSNRLRKGAGLSPAAAALLREGGVDLASLDAGQLARRIKAMPLMVTGLQGLERAISSAGGVELAAVDSAFMLRDRPGVFFAGEMLDWEAPTGGYLLQASFATAHAAAEGVMAYLSNA